MKILFFDGVCGLCNRVVDFLIRRDRNHILYFSPLQGKEAESRLAIPMRTDLNTVVLFENGNLYTKSDAVIRALKCIGGRWAAIAAFMALFPRVFRDHVYDVVAQNRYQWFGRKEVCRIPTSDERRFFLD